ncbi:MAG: vWA domain-containing protein, partial [Aestuariivirgaceae bacterium]
RVEELINYFPYEYEAPDDRDVPFSTHVSVMPSPWNTHTKLMHVGIKGYELPKGDKPKSNLVFLLDTSGSMNAPNKLPLLRNSFKLLLSSLQPDDTIAIVTYAGRAGTVLEPTKVRNIGKIYRALDRLRSRGSTAGAEGIRQAYQLAERNFDEDGVNRVILATDGDFNVGITDKDELKSYIERKRKSGIFLSILGVGRGNYNDALMQTLAQNGNGNASYIDSLSEAQKVLVEEAGSTLFTIAKDVKIQIEFNPQTVSEYRLIGYETRILKREDFNNDKIDAGEIGAGHTVTAIYEITPAGSEQKLVDDLRYQPKKLEEASDVVQSNEYALLKLRYKLPNSDTSTKIEFPVTPSVESDGVSSAPRETRFATAVAAFGQILRGGRFTGNYSFGDVIKLALSARGEDEFGYRAEFIKLVRLARSAAKMEPLKQ